MKHLLLLGSVFTLLFTVSCNKSEDRGAANPQRDIQMEQDRPGETPGFEKEEYREDVITPTDDRPDLEQERPDLEEEMSN